MKDENKKVKNAEINNYFYTFTNDKTYYFFDTII